METTEKDHVELKLSLALASIVQLNIKLKFM